MTFIRSARCFFSPPSTRVARGGEGSGVGGVSATSLVEGLAETPPTPDPSPPLRGGRGGRVHKRRRIGQLHQSPSNQILLGDDFAEPGIVGDELLDEFVHAVLEDVVHVAV